MSDRPAVSVEALRVADPEGHARDAIAGPLAVAHVGYTGTEEDRERRLQISIWLRRNDADLYRAWFGPGGDPLVEEDCIDLNGEPERDFLAEDRQYAVVVTHNLWGLPSEVELGGSGPAACSEYHGKEQWRRRLDASRARYMFLFGSDFDASLGSGMSGYDSYFVPSAGFLTVLVARPLSARLAAPKERISYRDMTRARLERLPEFMENRSLDLSYTSVNGTHLARLSQMFHVQDLRLVGTTINDDDLALVARCPTLRRLTLDASGISGAGLAHLPKLHALECLSVSETGVDDVSLRYLEQLPRLQWLSLLGTAISDAGLNWLEPIKSLRTLILVGTRVTAAGVEQLRTALPECSVDFRQ